MSTHHESTPLLDKPRPHSTNFSKALIGAAIVVVSLVGALFATGGATQLLDRAGYSFGPGELYAQPFFNDAGVEQGQCDFVTCPNNEPGFHKYSFVDNCLGGGAGQHPHTRAETRIRYTP
jgi:hypothetical protein